MKFLNKILGIATLSFALNASYAQDTYKDNEEKLRRFVGSNLVKIMQEQEEKLGELGIQHFGIPKIKYFTPRLIKKGFFAVGYYYPVDDTIGLSNSLEIDDDYGILIREEICKMGGCVRQVLNHELGHFYADKINESLRQGHFLSIFKYNNLAEFISEVIIGEGVAEYFERYMTKGSKGFFECNDWPRFSRDLVQPNKKYDLGYRLVKPILDKHGIAGIIHLIKNLPESEDLSNLQEYQKRVLEELEH